MEDAGQKEGSYWLTSSWPRSAEAAQDPAQTHRCMATAQATHDSQRPGAFSFLSSMWACSIITKPTRLLNVVMQIPNVAGTFQKNILAKFPSFVSDLFWVWVLQGDERCMSALPQLSPPDPKQSSCKADKRAPVFLHMQNIHSTPDPKCLNPLQIVISSQYSHTLNCQQKKIAWSYAVMPKGSAYYRILFCLI